MSVYKPQKGRFWHYDFQWRGRRFHGSTGQTSRAKAEAVERAQRLKAATGELDQRAAPTLDEAAGEWWAFRGADRADGRDLERRVALCLRLLGKARAANSVATDDVADAIRRRRGQLVRRRGGAQVVSNRTVNLDIVATLRPILKRAARLRPDLAWPTIAWAELTLPVRKSKPIEFTDAELAAIDAAADARGLLDFARFQRRYGLRIGEMFFDPSAVDVDGRRVTLRDRKGDDDHVVPLLADDAAMLAARVGRARAAGLATVWFRELRPGRLAPVRYGWALRAMADVMTEAGVRAAKGARGSHAQRHHRGMTMLRATGNLRTTQRLLGHASIQSTLVYAHALEADVRAALEAEESRPAPEPRPADDEQPLAPQAKASTIR